MEEKKTNNSEVIDLRLVAKKIWANKRLFYKTLPITFVLSCIYIFSLPRYYTSEVKLAPEMENGMGSGTLGSLAASFGIDLSNMQTSDAITPLLYPDLMEDNGFVTSMFNIRVKDIGGEIDATYHDYLKKYQKQAWFSYPIAWLKSLLPKKGETSGSDNGFNPYHLSKQDDDIAGAIRKNVNISIDKRTGVITINTQAQDALICQTLADSTKNMLQEFITNYRTTKARKDYAYYKNLAADAKKEYEKSRQLYGSFSDANTDLVLSSYRAKLEDLENEMQLKFNAYSSITTQLEAAKAKVQERTPAFTVLEGAAVPVKPAGPKRMLFVAAMLILAIIFTTTYIIKDELFSPFKAKELVSHGSH